MNIITAIKETLKDALSILNKSTGKTILKIVWIAWPFPVLFYCLFSYLTTTYTAYEAVPMWLFIGTSVVISAVGVGWGLFWGIVFDRMNEPSLSDK